MMWKQKAKYNNKIVDTDIGPYTLFMWMCLWPSDDDSGSDEEYTSRDAMKRTTAALVETKTKKKVQDDDEEEDSKKKRKRHWTEKPCVRVCASGVCNVSVCVADVPAL